MIVKNAAGEKHDIVFHHFFPTNRKRIAKLLSFVSDNLDIEENQETAMTRWELCGNFPGLFALKLTDNSVWMIHLGPLLALRTAGVSSINAEKIRMMGLELERWVKLKLHDRDSWSKTFGD